MKFSTVKTAEGDEFTDGIQSQRYQPKLIIAYRFYWFSFWGNFDGDLSYNINDIVDFDLTTKTCNSSLQVSNSPQTLSNFYSMAKMHLLLQTGQNKIIKVATDGEQIIHQSI